MLYIFPHLFYKSILLFCNLHYRILVTMYLSFKHQNDLLHIFYFIFPINSLYVVYSTDFMEVFWSLNPILYFEYHRFYFKIPTRAQ